MSGVDPIGVLPIGVVSESTGDGTSLLASDVAFSVACDMAFDITLDCEDEE